MLDEGLRCPLCSSKGWTGDTIVRHLIAAHGRVADTAVRAALISSEHVSAKRIKRLNLGSLACADRPSRGSGGDVTHAAT